VGKLLRIDVGVSEADEDGYAVPASNPFVGRAGVWPEIWAFGVRDPAQVTFDAVARGGSGALISTDVGAVRPGGTHEVNVGVGNRGGVNYGWPTRVGMREHNPAVPPASVPLTNPVVERIGRAAQPGDAETCEAADSAIVGGAVYRGAALGAGYAGRYVFATAAGAIYSVRLEITPGTGAVVAADQRNHTRELGGVGDRRCAPLGPIRAFSVDADGELNVVSATGVYRLVAGGCTTADPFAGIPGMWGVCLNGGWWPSNHPATRIQRAGGTGAAPGRRTPAPTPGTCTTPDPFISIPGLYGVCINGGWVPSNHPAAAGQPHPVLDRPAPRGAACATPDPFAAIPGERGVCLDGGWVPASHPLADGR
jgi:hypothetical protein